MADHKLARIHWRMGQTLLPDHLIAQENALLNDTAQRFSLIGVPFYGVGRLVWNPSLLGVGVLSLQRLAVIFPDGLFISVPGNAEVPSFNLNLVGKTHFNVYLHLLDEMVTVADGDEEEETIERTLHRLELSSEKRASAAVQSVKIARFEKDPTGIYNLSEWTIPPLLRIGSSPFLGDSIHALSEMLDQFHLKLSRTIADSFLSGESLSSAKSCLKALFKLKGFVANLSRHIRPHPYLLYEALREFYLELCFYQNAHPEHGAIPYAHDDPGKCLKPLFESIESMIQEIRGKAPYLSFERRNGLFQLASLPKDLRGAREIYLLIQKGRVHDRFAAERLKLASVSRLPAVHQHALHGVPLIKIERPPFQHPFGPEVEFFRLSEGEEWDHVLKDGSVAFYEHESFGEDLSAFLYWRP